MANTNTDLIRDQLMEAFDLCRINGYFLTESDASIFREHLNDLAESLDVIVEEFEVEEEKWQGDEHLQDEPLRSTDVDWSKPGARYEDDLVIIH